MTERDDFLNETLPRQIEAEKALILGNPAPRLEMWSRDAPVTLFSAGGQCEFGWDEVSEFFNWLAPRFTNGTDFRFDLQAVDVNGNLAYTVGFERYKVSIAGAPIQQRAIRVTHVYRREGGEWKIVHRHGDELSSD